MRIGAPVTRELYDDPEEWVKALGERGYSAAYCPVTVEANRSEISAYRDAAEESDIIIAEVGIWRNLIHVEEDRKREHIEYAKQCLRLADEVGALCAVNIAGSKNPEGRGPDAENFSPATFDEVVAAVQEVIDDVDPQSSFYTLELMPNIIPDSADSYLELIAAIDRERVAVHLDPVNIICTHRTYARKEDLVRECFAKLGPHIKSCHVKDSITRNELLTHIDECAPGEGFLDLRVFIDEAEALDPDLPLMLEHLPGDAQYRKAADHLRAVASTCNIDPR